jgi:hypothetical protein
MGKQFLYVFLALLPCKQLMRKPEEISQYIDMEYILQNVPDYTEANQLEQKKLKMEIGN